MEKGIKEQVAELIRESRKARGLTLKELGERIGVAESTVSLYESGKQNLTIETLKKVADALDLQFEAVFK
ncbi:helix-turn-helix domain-containing protein [Spirosoma rhododendri]|uniref:Helix-turn-helix transcriptional regulator n=1 Tax=Spirosoma rhododendri TaxID=2728024 RepID=A0A7L5E1E4_9BACT|nr:helix-turn-helix transcriptional regulator [Spirosoma rhododendri]QJD81550.1 helix-turn-helix transcriptional regulator [Spirosoma rhododendri]